MRQREERAAENQMVLGRRRLLGVVEGHLVQHGFATRIQDPGRLADPTVEERGLEVNIQRLVDRPAQLDVVPALVQDKLAGGPDGHGWLIIHPDLDGLSTRIDDVDRPMPSDVFVVDQQSACQQRHGRAADDGPAEPFRIHRGLAAEEGPQRVLLRRQDRLVPAQRLLRPLHERTERVLLTSLGELAQQVGGDGEGFLVPALTLIVARQNVDRAECIVLAGTGRFQEIEEPSRLVELAIGHFPPRDAHTGLGQVRLELQRGLIEFKRLAELRDLVELGRQAGHQLRLGRESLTDRLAELGRLLPLVEAQEGPVDLERGLG